MEKSQKTKWDEIDKLWCNIPRPVNSNGLNTIYSFVVDSVGHKSSFLVVHPAQVP